MKVKLMALSSGRAVLILLAETDAEHIVVDRIRTATRAGCLVTKDEKDEWNNAPTFELALSPEIFR